ncbi:MAG: HAD family hydrolase [Candidatus Eremiobacteraeota bacterium]|nr:HAD family hydrolase [Candidatus Eremiobacteraeota bacterium]
MNHKRTLLIDADDTLWENNRFFEGEILAFVALMKKEGLIPDRIEKVLREREIANVKYYGYGSRSFTKTMLEVYKEACSIEKRPVENRLIELISGAGERTGNYPITLLPGVEKTLPVLRGKNNLILLTKGHEKEQLGKIKRSGVSHYFQHIRVVPEKNESIYRSVIEDFGLDPEHTWMIGNSPKSDINPAKKAGMGTVLIPYHTTWAHEKDEIFENGRETVVLEDFSGLVGLF